MVCNELVGIKTSLMTTFGTSYKPAELPILSLDSRHPFLPSRSQDRMRRNRSSLNTPSSCHLQHYSVI